VAAPLNEIIPKLICSLDLPASKQSMFGSDHSSDHADLAYSNKIELVLRIQSMDMDLGPLPKVSILEQLWFAPHRGFALQDNGFCRSQGTNQEDPRCKLRNGPAWKLS